MDPLERAVQELGEQNYGSAIRSLEMLTARDPSNADAYKYLSQAYHQTGRREEAAEAAQRYAALRPADASGHYSAGVLLAQIGQTAASIRCMRTALSADPGHAKARRALVKLEGVDEQTGEPAAARAPVAAPTVAPEEDVRRRMPWQAKVAAALTVLASVAILFWLFLPGGPANPGPPTQNPEPSPHAFTTPLPDQPTSTDAENARTPDPTDTAAIQPQPDADTPAPTPNDERPEQPLPESAQPSSPAPGATSTPRPIFTPKEARHVAEQMDAAERDQIQGQLRVLANWLRNDPMCKDPDFWPILQASLATAGPSMVPGGVSIGAGEVMALITNADTNYQAADNIERHSRSLKSVLPYSVKQQIVQALALATDADQAYRSVQQALKQNNTTLSQQANQVLIEAAQEAARAAAQTPTG